MYEIQHIRKVKLHSVDLVHLTLSRKGQQWVHEQQKDNNVDDGRIYGRCVCCTPDNHAGERPLA